MGNSVQSRQLGCLGCIPSNDNQNFDSSELKIGLDGNKPMGKISQQSTAQLSVDEINFFKASSGRNVSLVRFYMSKGVNINTIDEERTSILHVAARHGSIQVLEELIQTNANLSLTDMAGWTQALHVAAQFSRSQVCQMLLQAGADINIRTRDGQLAQDLVRDKMTLEVFKEFIQMIEDINRQSTQLQVPVHTQNDSILQNYDNHLLLQNKVIKQQENAKEQYEDYYKYLRHRLSIVHQQNSNIDGTSRAQESNRSSPKRRSTFKPKTPSRMSHQDVRELAINHFNHKFNQADEPQEIASEMFAPSLSYKSLVMMDTDIFDVLNLVMPKQTKLSNFEPQSLSLFQSQSNTIRQIGISIFKDKYSLGLSFMILTGQVRPSSIDIAILLAQEEFQDCKVSLGQLFSNPQFNEGPKIFDSFIGQFPQETNNYIKALRLIFKRVSCEDDPYKLDNLVTGISKNLFKSFKKRPFASEAALHMFTFAVLILDVEIHQTRENSVSRAIAPCIQDFFSNIQGINDGENFDQNFINDVIDEMSRVQISNISKRNDESINSLKVTLDGFVQSIRLTKKNKLQKIIVYDMYQIEDFVFLINETKIKVITAPKGISFCSNEKKKDYIFQNQRMVVATSKYLKVFEVECKQKIKYMLQNISD